MAIKMSEFSDKVNELLSNPEALAKIMQIAQNIGIGTGETQKAAPAMASPEQSQEAPIKAAPAPAVQAAAPASDGLGALSGLLGNASALAPLLSGTASSDRRVALLKALKPFMTDAKQKRVDNVISAISISSTLNKFKPERS